MAKRKAQDPTEELESYLTTDLDVEIYEDLTEGHHVGLFEPLEFFKLLYSQYEFVKANQEKPLTIVNTLKKLKYSDKQKWFLLDHLESLIDEENTLGDKQLKICRARIVKECDRIAHELNLPEETKSLPIKKNKFDWTWVKQQSETLPDIKAKIKYLIEVKTEYEQTALTGGSSWEIDFWPSEISFAKKCELEIQKLKQLMTLEGKSKTEAPTKIEAAERNPEFTTARQVLAVHYLLQYAKTKNVNKTEIARFIEFLTGKNYDSIYKRVRDPAKSRKETLGSSRELEKDMDYVKSRFERLGLTEIVRMIENEKDWLRNDEDEDFEV